MSVYSYEVLQKRWRTSTDSSQCQLGGKPSTPRLASSALGYLATSSLTLGLKLHSVHFADKFSSASQARLQRTCLQSAPRAVSTQVHLSSCLSTPIRACEERWTQTWTRVYLSWNCTRCTLQTSSPEPSLRGGGELVCKVHRVQFQPQCQRGGSQVPRCRACEARGTWQTSELTLGRVGEDLPLFWSTSYEYTDSIEY